MATQIYNNSKQLGYSANSSTGYTYTFALKLTRDTQNVTSNYTPVTATCSLTSPASRWATSNSYGQLSVTLYWIKADGTYDSKTVTGDKINNSAYNTTYSVSVSQNVPHLDDGTSKVYAIGKWYSSASNSYRPASNSLTSSELDLPTIPRASDLIPASTYVSFGSSVKIDIDRKVDTYTDTITWVGYTPIDNGDGSYNMYGTPSDTIRGTIVEKTDAKYVDWQIPDELSSLIPFLRVVGAKLTCTTYNGDTVVGTTEKWLFARTAEETAKPLINYNYIETNETVIEQLGKNDFSIPVLNVSRPKFTFSATPRYNSTIKSLSITCDDGQTSSISPFIFSQIGSAKFTLVATDSRDYTTTIPIDLSGNAIPYIKPTIKVLNPLRESPISGEIILNANGSWYGGTMIDDIVNPLYTSYKCKISGSEEDPILVDIPSEAITFDETKNEWSIIDYNLGNITEYNKNYNFTLFIADYYSEAELSKLIRKGIDVFSLGEYDAKINGDLFIADEDGLNKVNVLETIGMLANLTTDDKISLVNAINEINEKKSANIMTISLSANTNYTISSTWSTAKIELDKETSVGDGLSFEDNAIKIGAGINVIKVNASALARGIANLQTISVVHNGAIIKQAYYTGATTSAYGNLSITPFLVDVSEGDVISLYAGVGETAGTLQILKGTFLTVEVIE